MKKKKQNLKKRKQAKKTPKNFTIPTIVLKSISLLSISLFLYYIIYSHPGYKWAFDSLVVSNAKFIYNNPDLSIDERYAMKLGFNYNFLKQLKDRTPEDAIILYPSPEVFYNEGNIKPFHDYHITMVRYANYFLYPRKVIYQSDTTNHYYQLATHVTLVNEPEVGQFSIVPIE